MTPTTEAPIRLLLVDDHEILRTSLRLLLESHGRMLVVGEACDLSSSLASLRDAQPDVVLLDLDLGDESGLNLITALREHAPTARIIVLTGLGDQKLHRQAVSLGAAGLVLKGQGSQILFQAIEHVYAGRAWLDTALVTDVVAVSAQQAEPDPEAARIASLTERERQTIGFVCEGLQNKLIAARMAISETTVRHHLTSIFTKLGLDSRLELVIYAYRHGLADLPERDPPA